MCNVKKDEKMNLHEKNLLRNLKFCQIQIWK